MADHLWSLLDADGTDVLDSRAIQNVLEAVCEGDGPIGNQLHWYRATNLILHWSGDMYPDESEHREPVDASMGGRLYYPRDYVAGVLVIYHVSDTGW